MKPQKFIIFVLIFLAIFVTSNKNKIIGQRLPQASWIDGALLRAEKGINVYWIYNNHKYLIPNPVTFENLGLSWDKVQIRDAHEINKLEFGSYIPHTPPGCLIREREAYTVYVVYKGKKNAIPDEQTARDLRGDKWNQYVVTWPKGVIDLIPKGNDIPKSETWGEHEFYGGYCTWYVSLKRKIPWNGNANQWLTNAKNAGFFTGDSPVQGSIMVTSHERFGHVALVEFVTWDRDGKWQTFQVSEMNWGSIRKGYEKLGRTANFNNVTTRYFTENKPPNPKTLLGFIY